MSDTLELRYHSQPCEHRGPATFDDGRDVTYDGSEAVGPGRWKGWWRCGVADCPGGELVTLRLHAVANYYRTTTGREHGDLYEIVEDTDGE